MLYAEKRHKQPLPSGSSLTDVLDKHSAIMQSITEACIMGNVRPTERQTELRISKGSAEVSLNDGVDVLVKMKNAKT